MMVFMTQMNTLVGAGAGSLEVLKGWLQQYHLLEWNHDNGNEGSGEGEGIMHSMTMWLESSGFLELIDKGLRQGDMRSFATLLGLMLAFAPMWVAAFVSMATMSAWMFWLLASALMGIFQVVYSAYQIAAILVDLIGLLTLKAFASLRKTFLYYCSWGSLCHSSNSTSSRYSLLKTRRREWKEALEKSKSYKDFIKIKIEPKHGTATTSSATASAATTTVSAIGKLQQTLRGKLDHEHRKNHSHKDEDDEEDILANDMDYQRFPRATSSVTPRTTTTTSTLTSPSSSSHRGGVGSGDRRGRRSDHRLLPTSAFVVVQELGEKTADLLVSTTARLNEARLVLEKQQSSADGGGGPTKESVLALMHILSSVIKRNHLHLEDAYVQNCRTIHATGQYQLSEATRNLIQCYYEEVEKALDWLAEGPPASTTTRAPTTNNRQQDGGVLLEDTSSSSSSSSSSNTSTSSTQQQQQQQKDLRDRVTVLRKMKQTVGRTALMLSGGGACSMYHMGVLRALIESNMYQDIKVISGSSGGSIVAAFCAIHQPDVLLRDVLVPTISTDYPLGSGEMKRQGIRWFPREWDMALYWLKHGVLMDSSFFQRTCEYYFGDVTFEEAFQRTGKHVCINVSASRAGEGTVQRLLLNHISTPRVTLASAVAASCALPGAMKPTKLQIKNSRGKLEPFEVDGVEWIDGSVQADVPFQRISTMFAATSFIVIQVNFYILPFLQKEHDPSRDTMYWKLFQSLSYDLRQRVFNLSRLGLFPSIFGDMSKLFKQRYQGNLTIVPRFTILQTLGLSVLVNPSVSAMEEYLKYGQIAAWPYLSAIRTMLRLETVLDECLERLGSRLKELEMDGGDLLLSSRDWSSGLNHQDAESIAAGTATTTTTSLMPTMTLAIGAPRSKVQVAAMSRRPVSFASSSSRQYEDRVIRKIATLEKENVSLRNRAKRLQQILREKGVVMGDDDDDVDDVDPTDERQQQSSAPPPLKGVQTVAVTIDPDTDTTDWSTSTTTPPPSLEGSLSNRSDGDGLWRFLTRKM